MLKRKATAYIKKWVNTKDKKYLVVQGARLLHRAHFLE